jgi:plastocyanin
VSPLVGERVADRLADADPRGRFESDPDGRASGDGCRDDRAVDRNETDAEGHSYEHQFEVAGTDGDVCVPHEDFGMAGRVVVA